MTFLSIFHVFGCIVNHKQQHEENKEVLKYNNYQKSNSIRLDKVYHSGGFKSATNLKNAHEVQKNPHRIHPFQEIIESAVNVSKQAY